MQWRGPEGRSLRIVLERRERTSTLALPLDLEHAPGTRSLTPYLLQPDGTFHAGRALSISSASS